MINLYAHPLLSGELAMDPRIREDDSDLTVIPAQAGIQTHLTVIPAQAGIQSFRVIPMKMGIQTVEHTN